MPGVIDAAIAHWRQLARDLRDWAVYEASRGEYTGVTHAKADQCDAAAKSLELEQDHGEPYCCCHLQPMRVMRQMDAAKVRRH